MHNALFVLVAGCVVWGFWMLAGDGQGGDAVVPGTVTVDSTLAVWDEIALGPDVRWWDEITVSDTTWFAEADGNRDIELYIDRARMKGDYEEPLYFNGTLYGRLYWVKGKCVFKGAD